MAETGQTIHHGLHVDGETTFHVRVTTGDTGYSGEWTCTSCWSSGKSEASHPELPLALDSTKVHLAGHRKAAHPIAADAE